MVDGFEVFRGQEVRSVIWLQTAKLLLYIFLLNFVLEDGAIKTYLTIQTHNINAAINAWIILPDSSLLAFHHVCCFRAFITEIKCRSNPKNKIHGSLDLFPSYAEIQTSFNVYICWVLIPCSTYL